MPNNYFKVTCKCGHVGEKYYIPISFPVVAATRKGASQIARYIPRVKHDHKDAILSCEQITYKEYLEIQVINNQDLYLKCLNKQEQKMIKDFKDRLVIETKFKIVNKKTKRKTVAYRLKKQELIKLEKQWIYYEEEEIYSEQLAY